MNREQFAKGIAEMAEKCPFNGNVSATFKFHSGNVCSCNVVSDEVSSTDNEEKVIKVFTPTIVEMLMYKLDRKKVYYGELKAIVSVRNGEYDFAEFLVSEKVSLGQAKAIVKTEHNRRAA